MLCELCGKTRSKRNNRFCSRACATKVTAFERDVYYKRGGRKLGSHGYAMILTREGYELEHRLLMEQHLGRKLYEWEDVHHKDENKLNNSLDNLEVMPRGEHMSYHAKKKIRIRDEKGRFN